MQEKNNQNPSLQHDHTYTKMNLLHPLTNTYEKYIVGDRFHDGHKTSGHKKETCKFHHMDLCLELPEVINSIKIKLTTKYYFIYNRLMDY